MARGIITNENRVLKGARKHYVQNRTQVWVEWLTANLTDKFEDSRDVYRRGLRHDIEMIDGFKSALREMVRLGTIELAPIRVGTSPRPQAVRYNIRKPQPKVILQKVEPRPAVLPAMDNADGESYRGALWRKLEGIEHKVDQLTQAVNALMLAVK